MEVNPTAPPLKVWFMQITFSPVGRNVRRRVGFVTIRKFFVGEEINQVFG